MRIALNLPSREALTELLREYPLDIGGGGPRRLPDGSVRTEAYVPGELLERLRERGAAVEIIEDATEVGKQRQKEVGRGDRFEGGKVAPHGLGKRGVIPCHT